MKRLATTLLAVLCLPMTTLCADDAPVASSDAKSFEVVHGAFKSHCVRCHGETEELSGDVDLVAVKRAEDLVAKPTLLKKLIDVLDTRHMPPEDEPQLATDQHSHVLAGLREMLSVSLRTRTTLPRTPIRRMNRFQYNNAVQDLLQLRAEVFSLPERILREHGGYFQPQSGVMPERLKAGSRPLGKSQLIERRLAGVTPFPQDLRAEHGFDNQADHLTLSPLLLESFLKLGRSIVDSPDFNAKNCGLWSDFFAAPEVEDREIEAAIRDRLLPFLTRAFRRSIDDATLERYVGYAMKQLVDGRSFTESMKAVTAAIIASPRFFYIFDATHTDDSELSDDDFALASRLSFFLWGSIPDQTLLDIAAENKLRDANVLAAQVDRMLDDRRLKRFCDSFPAQWLQLERIISSTPDRQRYPRFYFAKYRVSMHMMLEPLLLFESVLVEDDSILKFIDSDYSYRSRLLEGWYRDGSQPNATPVVIQFERVPVTDRRQGGLITNAAVMTMTSNATRTQPITRGSWIASVILNDPPEPPPADVPPLADKPSADEADLTLRERLELHRQRADCAGCHRKLDPLGFALENYDPVGIWRAKYNNGRTIDPSGVLFGKHQFRDIVDFKDVLLTEKNRFTRAFASHLLAFSIGREVDVADSIALDHIVKATSEDGYRFRTLLKQVVLSESFRH